jgi:hypothetical protein
MEFKQWLSESEGSGQEAFADRDDDNGNGWDLVYPTSAGDYVYDVKNPKFFWWLQWRWQRGEEMGRKLHNIDRDIFKWTYTSPASNSLPDNDWWAHKEDDGTKSSLDIKTGLDLVRMGVGEDFDRPLVLHGPMIATHGQGSDPEPPDHTLANPEEYPRPPKAKKSKHPSRGIPRGNYQR